MIQPGLLRPLILRTHQFVGPRTPCRYKSLTAAIERGKQNPGYYLHTNRENRGRERENRERPYNSGVRGRVRPDDAQRDAETWHSDRAQRERPPTSNGTMKLNSYAFSGRKTERAERKDDEDGRDYGSQTPGPESLPYTTAASEFLYGYSSVLAAIKANRRKLYKLYIHARGADRPETNALRARARMQSVDVNTVEDQYLPALDKASSGRPHNGFVLEASPLPTPPILGLMAHSVRSSWFDVGLDTQSKEDALVNGTQTKYSYKSAGWRHPLVLYVDGVLVEGNLGAIARSAYFLGVDAIVTPSRHSAPWSHITVKASAGAAEAIPIFQVHQAVDFLGKCARNGWRIYASDAIPPEEQRPRVDSSDGQSVTDLTSKVIYTFARSDKRVSLEHCPVQNHPTILMMGAEGMGLRSSLLNLAHYKVGIRHGRDVDEVGVDSLNVSVAASLLCYEMLKKPKRQPENVLF